MTATHSACALLLTSRQLRDLAPPYRCAPGIIISFCAPARHTAAALVVHLFIKRLMPHVWCCMATTASAATTHQVTGAPLLLFHLMVFYLSRVLSRFAHTHRYAFVLRLFEHFYLPPSFGGRWRDASLFIQLATGCFYASLVLLLCALCWRAPYRATCCWWRCRYRVGGGAATGDFVPFVLPSFPLFCIRLYKLYGDFLLTKLR